MASPMQYVTFTTRTKGHGTESFPIWPVSERWRGMIQPDVCHEHIVHWDRDSDVTFDFARNRLVARNVRLGSANEIRMSEEEYTEIIKEEPRVARCILFCENVSRDTWQLALREDGTLIKECPYQDEEMRSTAITNTYSAMQFIKDPSVLLQRKALNYSVHALKYFRQLDVGIACEVFTRDYTLIRLLRNRTLTRDICQVAYDINPLAVTCIRGSTFAQKVQSFRDAYDYQNLRVVRSAGILVFLCPPGMVPPTFFALVDIVDGAMCPLVFVDGRARVETRVKESHVQLLDTVRGTLWPALPVHDNT